MTFLWFSIHWRSSCDGFSFYLLLRKLHFCQIEILTSHFMPWRISGSVELTRCHIQEKSLCNFDNAVRKCTEKTNTFRSIVMLEGYSLTPRKRLNKDAKLYLKITKVTLTSFDIGKKGINIKYKHLCIILRLRNFIRSQQFQKSFNLLKRIKCVLPG